MPFHGFGGLERSVHDLVLHLARRGVMVTLIAPPSAASSPDLRHVFGDLSVTRRDVPYVTFPFANRRGTTILDRSTAYPIFGRRAGGEARAMVAAGAIDVVHGFGASVLGYARARAIHAKDARAPLVLNPQGLEEFGATAGRQSFGKRAGYAPLRAAVRACARAADVIIATDAALEPTVARHLRPRPGQVRTIPNGIDLAAVDALASASDVERVTKDAGIAIGSPVLVSAGRIEFNKGLDVLARALGQVFSADSPRRSQPWTWVIAGDGPYRSSLERHIQSAGIEAHVRLLGRVSDRDLHAWYRSATLFVHPTRYEGSSLVTLEAMAHRRAIVATRAGGLPDKVRPGVNGWLVEPDDAGALADAIVDALSAPARLLTMGESSRRIVEQRFAWTTLAEQYLALYSELVQRR